MDKTRKLCFGSANQRIPFKRLFNLDIPKNKILMNDLEWYVSVGILMIAKPPPTLSALKEDNF